VVQIEGDRLLADLNALRNFGRCGTGVDRTAFTEPDLAARNWLCDRLADAGLDAVLDKFGNVVGSWPGVDRAVLIGSHTDTVPRGGWLDGALGVIYGLDIARACRAALPSSAIGVDVVSFQEEEGAYLPLMGSRAFCGEVTDAEMDGAVNAEGRPLRVAIADAGLADRGRARLDLSRHTAFLEAHIEQGPRLEAGGTQIGVVTALVGIRRARIVCVGQADHAGTTPMAMRKDAAAAMVLLAHELLAMFERRRGPDTVWNLGKATFEPGAYNVVPARAEMLLEFRDISVEKLSELQQAVAEIAAAADGRGGVAVEINDGGSVEPARLDAELIAAIAAAAARHGASTMAMPSDAAHDAIVLSRHVPSAMLFITSIGGRSHDVAEDSHASDIVRGCQVLAEAVAVLIGDAAA
jgi:N-carbamoyl-L-amino-acid hydrolase